MVTTQEVNGCTSGVFGNAWADWLGTSRGSSCEGPSHHSVLDSSQPCWHPSRQPPHTGTHIRKLQVSYTQILGYQHAFFRDSVGLWGTTCPVIYVVDSDQVAKFHVLKTAQILIYSHLLYSIRSVLTRGCWRRGCQFFFFFRYSTGPYEGIAYCVCVAECVDNSREQVHIYTEVAINRVLEWSQHRTRSWESRSVKVSMLFASVTSIGRAFHRRVPSGKIPRWYAKVRAYGTRNWAFPFLLLAGACMMWSDARMSTIPWTIMYIMVMRAFTRRSARGSQPSVFRMAVTLLVRP